MQELHVYTASARREDLLTWSNLLQGQLIFTNPHPLSPRASPPPQHPDDNPDGAHALQTDETFSAQTCVTGRPTGLTLSDNFSSYKEIKPGDECAISNACTYIYFLIC